MFTTPRLVAIALCAALNFAIGNIVYLVKLPIYLDSIGTILCALLLAADRKAAFVCACLAGGIGILISGLLLKHTRVDARRSEGGAGDIDFDRELLFNTRITPKPIGHAEISCTHTGTGSLNCTVKCVGGWARTAPWAGLVEMT